MVLIFLNIDIVLLASTLMQSFDLKYLDSSIVGMIKCYKKKILLIIIFQVFTCGQTGPNVSANLVPFQGGNDLGSSKRCSPIGGKAYGTALNTSTGSKCREFNSNITPRIAPVFVSTMRELYLGPANTVFVSNNHSVHCMIAHCRHL